MTVKFEVSTPDQIRSDLKALKYLANGAEGFGETISVKNILDKFDKNWGLLIIVKNDLETVGAIYLTFTQQEWGKIMTSVLLGGDDFYEWANELRDFYYQTAKQNDCVEFNLMGRRGFKKLFPELKEVATVFRVSLSN